MILPIQVPANLPFLSSAFGNHMVMQRGVPNEFWGWTAPGSRVSVAVGGHRATGIAGKDGRWSVRILPPKVGGPYTVTVDGSKHVELSDVLVGDVWLCSGQSNMEFGLSQEKDGLEEVAAANDPQMRIFLAPRQAAPTPQMTNGGTWKTVTPETIAQDGWGGFSAVGYHFGKALRRELGVPIGLVEASWGGTVAEAWTSREALRPLKDFNAAFPLLDAQAAAGAGPDQGEARGYERADFDDSAWKTTPALSLFHDLGLDAFDGTVWARRELMLTDAQAAGGATLALGAIDDDETTWVNGVRVGATGGYNIPRVYALARGALRPGRNVVVVRIVDVAGPGGFFGPARDMALTLADGTRIPLSEGWRAQRGAALALSPNAPTALSNGMIEPLVPLALRGVIWYQGESNADRATQYRCLLPALIADWRRRFGQERLPFYVVSLASYMPRKASPSEDAWAELREAQALTARSVPNSGLAVTIDIGDAADIHPKDKRTVGERLARIALEKSYRRSVVSSGPTFRALSVRGSEARVRFDHTEGGLVVRGGSLGEFSVAGSDHIWRWATARIEGDEVVVSSPEVPRPVAVRYAWQANPLATLYNGAGLPAAPFRTDDWTSRRR